MAVDAKLAQQIFLAALDAASAADRAAVLDRECAGDPDLRRRVEALLRAYDEPDGPLDRAAVAAPVATAGDQSPSLEGVGSVLAGRYKLLEAIGEGGMGAVFMAQQTEPVRRIVAVKLIKAGMDSRQVLARFDAERQALALMDHPNIAKVLDASATDCGRPFFVMELVKGVPITKFCDERKLTPRQRLELFVPVCQAIQHAHQKGVIHRDVKPSNVLVAMYDDRPVPKVIDFGVAKAAGPQLTEQTLATGFGTVVGTLEYMSPEQASFNALDVDTRSDVYALGVLLYELLTGTTPLDRRRLKRAALMEALRLVREEEAPKPSVRLSSSETLPSAAANRQTEPAKLSRLLRGELDWVVLKALEKDRARRYETASGLARDLQRYLADEVVEARPPSAGYRLQKFVKRNKGRVVAASVVLAVLVVGVVGTTLGLVRALDAESKTLAALAAARTAKGDEAEQRAAAECAAAWAYRSSGKLDEAIPLFERTLKLMKSNLGPDHPETVVTEASLGVTYRDAGRLGDAIPLLQDALDRAGQQPGPLRAQLAWLPSTLAETYDMAGRFAESEPLYREAVGDATKQFGPDDSRAAGATAVLALNLLRQHKDEDAEPLLRACLAVRQKQEPDAWTTFNTQSLLGGSLLGQKKHAEAEPLLLAGYEGMDKRAGKIPPVGEVRLAEAAERLVRLYQALNHPDKAAEWRDKERALRAAATAANKPASNRSGGESP